MIPHPSGSTTLEKAMFDRFNSVTNGAIVVVNVAPSLKRVSHPYSAMENQPQKIVLFVFVELKTRFAPNRGPPVDGAPHHGTPETIHFGIADSKANKSL